MADKITDENITDADTEFDGNDDIDIMNVIYKTRKGKSRIMEFHERLPSISIQLFHHDVVKQMDDGTVGDHHLVATELYNVEPEVAVSLLEMIINVIQTGERTDFPAEDDDE